jgi:hypothetical protein
MIDLLRTMPLGLVRILKIFDSCRSFFFNFWIKTCRQKGEKKQIAIARVESGDQMSRSDGNFCSSRTEGPTGLAWWPGGIQQLLSMKLRGPGGRPRTSPELAWMDGSFIPYLTIHFSPLFAWLPLGRCCGGLRRVKGQGERQKFELLDTRHQPLSFRNFDALMQSSFGISSMQSSFGISSLGVRFLLSKV